MASSSPLSSLVSRWSPLKQRDATKRVVASDVKPVAEPIHANQRVEKTFTITRNATANATVSELWVESPGLTVVRVRPEIVEEDGPEVLAKVRVSSDAAEHIERLRVETSPEGELTLDYKARKGTIGHLVAEIEVPSASQVALVMALGGGDVVVSDNVLGTTMEKIQRGDTGTSLLSAMGSHLFVSSQRSHLKLEELFVGCVGSSTAYIETSRLSVDQDLIAMISGRGRVEIQADEISCANTTMLNFGASQTFLSTSRRFETTAMCMFQRGPGSIEIGTPGEAKCETIVLEVERQGQIDIASLSPLAAFVDIKAPHGGIVTMESPQNDLTLHCSSKRGVSGVFGYRGVLPPIVWNKAVDVPGFRVKEITADELQIPRPSVRRIEVPTVKSAFEKPVALEDPKEGWFMAGFVPVLRTMLPF